MSRPPLHIYAPLPSRTGIADYASEQLPYFARDWDVTVVIDDAAPQPAALPPGVALRRRSEVDSSDTLRLYHCGNNPHHEYVFHELRSKPGVTILHDIVLHHLVVEMTLARQDLVGYLDFMQHEHGQLGLRLARERIQYWYSDLHQFWMPLNRTVMERSLGLIVHSPSALERLPGLGAGQPVSCIPHHFCPPTGGLSREEARASLGIPSDQLMIGTFGFLREQKMVDLVLRALRRVRHRMPPFQYWLVGEFPPHAKGLSQDEPFSVRHTGYVDMEQFYRCLAACDIVVNLTYPSVGETSGTLVRALGMGACALVFDYGTYADYPSEVVVRVPLETQDGRPLSEAILDTALDRRQRQRVGAAARSYVAREHNLERCVNQYTAFLRRVGESRPPHLRGYVADHPSPPQHARDVVERYVADMQADETELWIHTLEPLFDAPPFGQRALVLGGQSVVMAILRHHFGVGCVVGTDYDESHGLGYTLRTYSHGGQLDTYDIFLFSLQSRRYPFSDGFFDLAVACAITPPNAHMLSECNRVLQPGGRLLLSTSNRASRGRLDWMLRGNGSCEPAGFHRDRSPATLTAAPEQLERLLHACGFEISHLQTQDSRKRSPALEHLLGQGHCADLRGDTIVALGTKNSWFSRMNAGDH